MAATRTLPSAPPNRALRVDGLRRSFPRAFGFARREVLRGIDLELSPGSVLSLVGPNGSGKSTLLRLAAGVDRPSAGRVLVFGEDPARSPRARARLAWLPEESPFPGELSAGAALGLLASLYGLPRRAARVRAAALLERLGLGADGRRPLRGFSRGMLRRFGLAWTFLTEPELVLLDEPTAGLDAEGFLALADLLAEAQGRGASVVLSSHQVEDVLEHADFLAVLLNGRLAAHGPPRELFADGRRFALEVSGLDADGVPPLARWIEERGGRLERVRPGGSSLLELYRREGERERERRAGEP